MKNWHKKSFHYVRLAASVLILALILMPFQNCGNAPEATTSSSSGQNLPPGTTPTPTPTAPPVTPTPTMALCPVTTNPNPTGSIAPASVNLNVGMGDLEGNGANQQVTVSYSANGANSMVTDINCDAPDNSGVDVNCNFNTPASTGTMNIGISVSDEAECQSGPLTISVRANDQILVGNTQPAGCQNLARNNVVIGTFVINRTNTCLPTQRVNAATPYNAGQFGTAVAIDGARAVSTAPGDEAQGVDAGAAFVMERGAGANPWVITQKLMPSGANGLISAVALSGNSIALGSIVGNGTVWVYSYNGATWSLARTLNGPALGSNFGRAVAISGDVVAVGAPGQNNGNGTRAGAVYVYSISSGASLGTLSPVSEAGEPIAQSEYGTSLSFSGNRLAVGAPFPNTATARREAVYVYDNLSLLDKIMNANGVNNRFGYSVSVDGGNLAIGAPYANSRIGAAYLYSVSASSAQTRNFDRSDENDEDNNDFGYSVSVRGTRVAVSAPAMPDPNVNTGAVYFYGTGSNALTRKIRARSGDRGTDQFGYSLGLSSDGWMVSGALNDDQDGADNAGAVYFVDVP